MDDLPDGWLADEFAYVEARSAVERELHRLGFDDGDTKAVLRLAAFLKSVKPDEVRNRGAKTKRRMTI